MAHAVVVRPRALVLLSLTVVLSGCVLKPAGTDQERQRIAEAGKAYEPAVEKRVLPELAGEPTWQDVLHRAFLANGDLEAAYFEWKAASERIDMAAAYPNTNLSLGFEYMFSKEKMKSWDRTTVTVGADPMQSLSLPVKVKQAGRVALQEARARGQRFAAAKFDLQRRILTSYLDYALMAEMQRIERDNVALLRMIMETAAQRVQAGGQQQDLLKADVALRLSENELRNMEAQLPQMRAMLNGMLARPGDAPLGPPKKLPEARVLGADDARLVAAAVDQNPELAALAHEVAGRKDALQLARLQYLPDINPVGGFTGSMEQFLGAMISIPITTPMIRGAVNEARAMLRASEAMARQTRSDRAASFVATLYALRNHERQIALFENHILPATERVLVATRQSYAAGTVAFVELIDSQRMLLDVRRMIAEARIEREKRLAELEALAGVDIEALAGAATRPATQPATTTAPADGGRGDVSP